LKLFLKYILPVFLLITLQNDLCYSQNHGVIDSLLIELKTAKDTGRSNTLNNLSWEYMKINDLSKARVYSSQALLFSQQLKFSRGIARSYSNIGSIYEANSDLDSALIFYFKSLHVCQKSKDSLRIGIATQKIAFVFFYKTLYDSSEFYDRISLQCREAIKDLKGMATSYNTLGEIYRIRGEYNKALGFHIKALELRESINDKRDISLSLNNIGIIYYYQRNYDQCLEYYQKALKIREDIGNKGEIASTLNNIGLIYFAKKNFEKATEYYLRSIPLFEEIGNESSLSYTYINLADVYDKLDQKNKALQFNIKGLRLAEKTNDLITKSSALINIGNIYKSFGDNAKAVDYLQQGLLISQKVGSKETVLSAYKSLADVYSKKGDFKNAYAYHMKYSDLKDTLLDQETSKQITEIGTKYDTEKKDKEIKLLNKDKILKETEIQKQKAETEKQAAQRNAFIIGFALVLVLALFIFRGYKQKQKANEIIELQKNEVQLQKELVEEKQKEILDSIHYAKRIQGALMASESLLKKNLPEYFVLYKPKDIVSGDFYWANSSGNNFLLCTADCTGHGVPGAFMSLLNISLLNETVIEKKITRPDLILNNVRNEIIRSLNPEGIEIESKDGMDCILCNFDFQKMTLEVACSNNPLWVIPAGNDKKEITELKPDKMPVGIGGGEMKPFSLQKLDLQKGDIIYTFTDGFVDQFGGTKGKKFKYKQLQEIIIANTMFSMNEQKQILDRTFESWRGNLEQVDDVLIIGIKV
jgi:serine phosphatase RsbU (regulator of sigma subunit)